MVLVDSSVWIEHLRAGNPALACLLSQTRVLTHPLIAGELACGNLRNRAAVLADFNALPSATPASHQEVLRLVDDRKLSGRGLGWIDMHLLASARLSGCQFWTLDRRLAQSARDLGLRG